MKIALCCLASLLAVIFLLLGIHWSPPPELPPHPADRSTGPAGAERLPEDPEQAWQDDVPRRMVAQQQIAKALAARRLTLLEAAARVRAMYRQAPDSQWRVLRRHVPGKSDAERFCRVTINWTAGCQPKGNARDELLAPLERDLQAHLRTGTLRLPD